MDILVISSANLSKGRGGFPFSLVLSSLKRRRVEGIEEEQTLDHTSQELPESSRHLVAKVRRRGLRSSSLDSSRNEALKNFPIFLSEAVSKTASWTENSYWARD